MRVLVFDVVLEGSTEKALKFSLGREYFWVPRGVVYELDPEEPVFGEQCQLALPEYFASDKGLDEGDAARVINVRV